MEQKLAKFPNQNRGSDPMRHQILSSLILLALVALPLAIEQPIFGATPATGPLATYQATGPPVQIFYQIINNTSFETGTRPWTLTAHNNFTQSNPGVNITSPGYNDNSAVQLTLSSGN